MLKKLIVIENDIQKGFDSKEELVKELIDSNYYNLTKQEQEKVLNDKAILNSTIAKINNSKFKETKLEDIKKMLDVKNETSYILSLLKLENIVILEEKNANIFLKDIDKSKYKNNYIILNNCINEI